MTSGLGELYGDVILDHHRHPRNFRRLESGLQAEGYNPLCGDRLRVFLSLDNGIVRDASFQGFGCAIARASASLMTESVKGKTTAEVDALFDRVQGLVTAPAGAPIDEAGPFSALAAVRRFPARVTCVTLPWQTLRAAAAKGDAVVSTE